MFNISVNASILTTGEYAEHELARVSGELISPEQAVTIASWWQSPGSIGHVLASFASGCEVDNEDLLADIDATISEATDNYVNSGEIDELIELKNFVESFNF